MIRIYKDTTPPISLMSKKSYDNRDVQDPLFANQHGKCYICERCVGTDFQIEHYKSQSRYQNLISEWTNLFLACSYCNGKKKDQIDSLLNPLESNIEEIIKQEYDFNRKQFVFTSRSIDEPTTTTIELLHRVFNRTKRIRTKREDEFRRIVCRKLSTFHNRILDYINNPSVEIENPIHKELSMDSELLGQKYWMIKSNATVATVFSKNIKWNKE